MSSMEIPRISIFLKTSFRSPEMKLLRCFSRMTVLVGPRACQNPLAYCVGYLQVDGFMLVEFHGCLHFKDMSVLYPADTEVGQNPEYDRENVTGEDHDCLDEILHPSHHDFCIHGAEGLGLEMFYGGNY